MYRYVAAPWLVFAALALSTGCGGGTWSYPLVGTQRDPGAEGNLDIEMIEGGNRLVTATFRHMTPPERLNNALRIYVMWFRDRAGHSAKASLLSYDPDSRTARATATTPMAQFIVIVTAERSSTTTEPSENVVFQHRVSAQ